MINIDMENIMCVLFKRSLICLAGAYIVLFMGCSEIEREHIRGSTDVAELTRALEHDNPMIVIAAAERLGTLKDQAAIPALIKALANRREQVLSKIKHPNLVDPGNPRTIPIRPFIISALSAIGEPVAPPLIEAFNESSDPFVREGAVKIISYMHGESVIETILQALNDPNRSVRGAATNGLLRSFMNTKDKRMWEAWKLTLKDPDEWIRLMAISQGRRGDHVVPDTIEYLGSLLEHDSSDRVRSVAAEQLGFSKSKQAIAPLIRALYIDSDSFTRCECAYSLGKLARHIDPGSIRITEALRIAAKDVDPSVRKSAEGALKCANNEEDMPFGCR